MSWVEKQRTVDGMVLITKNVLTSKFRDAVLNRLEVPAILHCTCTGMGGTVMEEMVPAAADQIDGLWDIIRNGFPSERCVIRIDPIITPKLAENVIQIAGYRIPAAVLKNIRWRVSLVDIYPHVRERCKKAAEFFEHGIPGIYPPSFLTEIRDSTGFQLSREKKDDIRKMLEKYPEYTFETCAEPTFNGENIRHVGCISVEDLRRMGLKESVGSKVNPQNRNGCLCLSCKTELLTRKNRCPHRCLYCYWRD